MLMNIESEGVVEIFLIFWVFWVLVGILVFYLFYKLYKFYCSKNPAKNIPRVRIAILIFVLAILIFMMLMVLFPPVEYFFDKHIFRYFESGAAIPFITAGLIVIIVAGYFKKIRL